MDEETFDEHIRSFCSKYARQGWELKQTPRGEYAYLARQLLPVQLGDSSVFANYFINRDQVFRVPVFSAMFFTESGHRLTMAELKEILPLDIGLTSVSEREHELTGTPVFFIHPCKTEEFIHSFLEDGADYLHVWLVSYGPVFLYKLPF